MTALTWPRPRASLRIDNWVFVAVLCALPLLFNLLWLTEPFDHDEGVYATVAQGMLDGYLPYRDLFDHKPPIIFGWYATAFVLFGENEWAPRLLGCLALSATAWLIHGCAAELYSARAGLMAVLVFGVASAVAATDAIANVEPFLLLPLVGMLRLYLRARRPGVSAHWMLLAGLLAGVSLLTKEVAVWQVAVIGSAVLFGGTYRISRLAWFAAGTALPVLVTFGAFWATGAAGEFVYANVEYNLIYGSTVEPALRLRLVLQAFPIMFLLAAPAVVVAAAGAIVAVRRFNDADWLVLAWSAASLLAVASTGQVFPHYFVLLLPAYGLLAAALFSGSIRWVDVRPRQRVAAVGVLGGAAVLAVLLNLPAFVAPSAYERQAAKGGGGGWENAFVNKQVGDYLEARSVPSERVWQAGRESGMYFHADRRPAAPMFYDAPFWLDEQALSSTLADLRDEPPVYVVDALSSVAEYEADHRVVLDIRAFIAESYNFETEIGYAKIYRLRQ